MYIDMYTFCRFSTGKRSLHSLSCSLTLLYGVQFCVYIYETPVARMRDRLVYVAIIVWRDREREVAYGGFCILCMFIYAEKNDYTG